MRAVLDPNVLISALLSAQGAPAKALRSWLDGGFELVVSRLLLEELQRALAYPKLRKRVEPSEAEQIVEWLRSTATLRADPSDSSAIRSRDPGDNYLIALAEAERAILISGDRHLLELADVLPVYSPPEFLGLLAEEAGPAVRA